MAVCFGHFGDARDREARSRALDTARQCWVRLDGSARPESLAHMECVQLLRGLDPRLGLEPDAGELDWVVTYDGVEARGLAELVAGQAARTRVRAGVGRGARPLPRVLDELGRRWGVDLSTATVRGGFTRGHLLELVVGLPGGAADPEELAEELVDVLLGEALVDDWVAAVAGTPLPRTGPLRVLQPAAGGPEAYPIAELRNLVASATAAVDALLPDAPHWRRPVGAEWVWLELEPTQNGPQSDRISAVTWLPELLKCALEGLPFHSRRFSRWGERFVWLRCPAARGSERVERRERVERALDAGLRAAGHGALVGTGFGERSDYFDLCLGADDAALHTLLALMRQWELGARARGAGTQSAGTPSAQRAGAELGFYDTRWAEERLVLD